jgi:FlaA1/EpsC-like NDP-sugar epimerase
MLSRGGEIFMLDMGQPVRILDLAKRMIRLSGYQVGVDIPIEIIGSRPGEKFDEVLSMPDEEILSTSHPHIHQLAPVAPHHDALDSDLRSLYEASECRDASAVRSLLFNSVTPQGEAAEASSGANVSAPTNEKPALEVPAMLGWTLNTTPTPVGGGGGGG